MKARTLGITLATSVMAALALPAAAETVLRYAHVGAPGETQTRYAEELAELVHEKTEGRIEIQVFPGAQLGNTQQMVDSVSNGSIAMAHHDIASLSRFEEDIGVFNAPFIYDSPEAAMRATAPATSPLLEEFNERLVENGNIRVVANLYRGARQLTLKEPITTPEELEGKKIRVPTVELWISMVEGMGAIPTPLEITEVMPALVTGLVDGQENPLNNIRAQKFYEANPYIIMTSHMESALVVFVNDGVWQGLDEGDRALMEEAFAEMAERSLQWEREEVEGHIKFLEGEGVTFVREEDGLDRAAFREQVTAKLLEDYPDWADYIERLRAVND
jgi:tripartite ATP-independent transporter DctP family solute receptor